MPPVTAETKGGEGAAMQRVRVGALGLAGVFLLVMLATAFLHAASDGDLANETAIGVGNAAEPSEPLAQLGVAPGNPSPDSVPVATPPATTRSTGVAPRTTR